MFCPRCINTSWQNKLFTCLIYIRTQSWFPRVSLLLFPKYGIEIILVSLFRLLSMVTRAFGFHTTEWHNLMVRRFIFPAKKTAISPSSLLKLCHSSIAIIATLLILLLAMLLLMLFNSVHNVLTSCQRSRIALKDRPGQQSVRANIKFTCSQLHYACPILNQRFSKWGI